MNRTDRLYAIVEQLPARAPATITARELAERFEVSRRTIERDIAGLQQAGTPIWSDVGRRGGLGIDPTHTLPPINLTVDEALAIAIAIALGRDTSSPFTTSGGEIVGGGVRLAGSWDAFEELADYVAAEANAEPNRRRARLLNAACDAIETALEGV